MKSNFNKMKQVFETDAIHTTPFQPRFLTTQTKG